MYTKEQIRKIAKAHGGINTIENALPGKVTHEKGELYPEGDILEGTHRWTRVFTPYTDSNHYSRWRLAIKMRHNGEEVYVWFDAYNWEDGRGIEYHVDQVWRSGIGKKMRRDGVWNLRKKMENRAHLVKMIECEPQVQTPDCEICEGDINKCTCK